MFSESDVQYWVDELDDEACAAAQKEFTREFGAEVTENCDRLLRIVAVRYNLLRNGERPKAFGAFDRDEIERILTYDLNFEYDGYQIDFSADFETATDCNDCIIEAPMTTASEEAWTRYEFVKAFMKYLETAAAFAKSIGAIPASRLYMRAYLILEPLDSDSNLSPEDAHRFAMFEKIATEMLIVDYLAYKLPPFKPREVTPAKKPAKKPAAKAKGGAK